MAPNTGHCRSLLFANSVGMMFTSGARCGGISWPCNCIEDMGYVFSGTLSLIRTFVAPIQRWLECRGHVVRFIGPLFYGTCNAYSEVHRTTVL